MKKALSSLLAFICLLSLTSAQGLQTPRTSKKASVCESIGMSKICVDYSRPGVKGRDGKVYGNGNLVPYDGGKPMPWRAGADENTVIYFANDVKLNGNPLPAGKYGFHIIPEETQWTLIFSKDYNSWGSYFYNPANDALRFVVKPETVDFTEWLTYEFVNQTDKSADLRMRWERKGITFLVETDVYANTVASIEKQLQGSLGFDTDAHTQAAQYVVQNGNGKDLDKALAWADRAITAQFAGQSNFQTLSTKAQVLDKMGKADEAKALMDKALPLGSITDVHFYGRSLIASGKNEEALKIFKWNREKHPEDKFTTFVGLARGHMAVGKHKEAAQYFRQAAPNAPEGQANTYEMLAKECDDKAKNGG